MSAREVIRPVWELACDHEGCRQRFRAPTGTFAQRYENGTRELARRVGWQTRPIRGKGSRSALDLCPEHRTDRPAPSEPIGRISDQQALADRIATGCVFDIGLCACPAAPYQYRGCKAP